ncbi:hypothetical protein T01_5104 [Trichinella spiralis]|uniref:Uncharacterized protein n=1 Tax=Trichinella spiralis TaxID=6334 RepID=A0A0V1BUV8_TRISP|nr:hypothetical protein T01_5104 [Trichinella spiralis]
MRVASVNWTVHFPGELPLYSGYWLVIARVHNQAGVSKTQSIKGTAYSMQDTIERRNSMQNIPHTRHVKTCRFLHRQLTHTLPTVLTESQVLIKLQNDNIPSLTRREIKNNVIYDKQGHVSIVLRKDFSTPPKKGEPGFMRHRMVPPGGVILQIGLLFFVWFSPSPI